MLVHENKGQYLRSLYPGSTTNLGTHYSVLGFFFFFDNILSAVGYCDSCLTKHPHNRVSLQVIFFKRMLCFHTIGQQAQCDRQCPLADSSALIFFDKSSALISYRNHMISDASLCKIDRIAYLANQMVIKIFSCLIFYD